MIALARAALALSAAAVAGFLVLQSLTPMYAFLGSAVADSIFALGYLAYSIVGALVVQRQPRLIVAWILVGIGLSGTVTMIVDRYAAYSVFVDPSVPWAASLGWLGGWLWMPGDIAITTFLPLLFPNGSLPSRRWRPVLWLSALAMLLGPARALRPGPISENFPSLANPYALSGVAGEAVAQLELVLFLAWPLAALLSVAALVVRLRRARGTERQQLKWFGSGMAFVALSFVAVVPVYLFVGYEAAAEWITGLPAIGITLLPVAAGVAILRYRLYDIDVLIRRTLTYAAISAVLVATYVAAVVLAGTALRPFTAGSDLAVAASTLFVVALFQPVRRRVQDLVDRRFYRARYDAARILDGFSARLRSDVELESVRADLIGVVADTVRPAHASLWLR
ncbi:MAG: hypothetical protein ACRDGT_05175 [Candidatus Limnocylindria bacterium]